jgi:hypothetical protein
MKVARANLKGGGSVKGNAGFELFIDGRQVKINFTMGKSIHSDQSHCRYHERDLLPRLMKTLDGTL